MTNVTRSELEACARLIGGRYEQLDDNRGLFISLATRETEYCTPWNPLQNASDLMALARAAKLVVNYASQTVHWHGDGGIYTVGWPADGTEAECIIKAASAAQLEREKANG